MSTFSIELYRSGIQWVDRCTHRLPTRILDLFRQVGGSQGPIFVVLAALGMGGFALYRSMRRVYRAIYPPRHLSHLPCLGMSRVASMMVSGIGFLDMNEKSKQYLAEDAQRKKIDPTRQAINTTVRWLVGTWVVLLSDPVDIKEALTKHEVFEKALMSELGFDTTFFGMNVALAPTHEWKRHRKVVNPAFRRKWPTELFGDLTRVMIEELDRQSVFDPADMFQRMTLDALSVAAFGTPMDALRHPENPVVSLYNQVMGDLLNPARQLIPRLLQPLFPMVRQMQRRTAQFNDWIYSMIDEREKRMRARGGADGDDSKNLLELMIEANQDHTFSREDLRANTVTFFVAGHDTTALALCFQIYLLGMHPQVQEKLRKEVISILGDIGRKTSPDDVPIPTHDEINQMKYMTWVIKEGMRLYPSVTTIPLRKTTQDVVLHNGTWLPKGSYVNIDVLGVQRSPWVWGNDADAFRPERWKELESAHQDDEESVRLHPSAHDYKWLPFGGGQRICLGQQFSIVEQKVVLSMMVLRYAWRVVGNERALAGKPETMPGMLLHAKGIQVQLTRRDL